MAASSLFQSSSLKRKKLRDDLTIFYGSKQEILLKDSLESLSKGSLFYSLVMKSCNASKPVNFNKADVTLRAYEETLMETLSKHECQKSELLKVGFEALFDMSFIKNLIERGLAAVPKSHHDVFHALLNFLHNVEHHESAIRKVKQNYAEKSVGCSMTAIMAIHLLSQLVPGHKYAVDKHSINKNHLCPCGCNRQITYDITSIGSDVTWHGYADVIVNKNVPVIFLQTETEKSICSLPEEDEDHEPAPKKPHIDEMKDTNTSLSCVGKTCSGDNRCKLLKDDFVDHIIAESITNAFAQINSNTDLAGRFVPTIGCTTEHVVIFLYDPIHDILLMKATLLHLWNLQHQFISENIIFLWMMLNFRFFLNPNFAKEYNYQESGFHRCAECSLENYRKITFPSYIWESGSSYFADFVLPQFVNKAKFITAKNVP